MSRDPQTLPVLRVVVMGDEAALSEFDGRVASLGWPTWPWYDSDELCDVAIRVSALCTGMNRLMLVVAREATPRVVVAGFDAEVLVLAASRKRPTETSGPPRMYGRQVFPHATPVLWLGAHARPTVEERTLRGALRAYGLPCDEAEAVWSDLDPKGEHLAQALDAVYPCRPDDTRGIVRRDPQGTAFHCGGCARALTRPMRRVRSHPPPQTGDDFRHNRQMFPGGSVYAYGADADAWGRRQIAPSRGAHEVALFDHRDLLPRQSNTVEPRGGGCCGTIPVGAMNLACGCGHRVGYTWSECAFYAVVVLRLDRVTEARTLRAGGDDGS